MNHNLLLTIAKYSILEAIRDRFLVFILTGVIAFFSLSLFIGELAITESVQMQTAILASVLRLFSVFTMGLFVITSMLREFNDKGFELILSHPVPRSSYFFGKFSGFAVVALLIASMCMCCLFFYTQADLVLFWSVSLFCELLIIIALSLLCLFSFNSITISFSMVIGFYILSRSIETIQLISDSPIVLLSSVSSQLVNGLLDVIAYVVPEIHRFTQTNWLIYISDVKTDMLFVVGQTLVYVFFLSCIALFDLYRKEL
jgi:ABC-type Na+ efflux pump permease subunit